MLLAGGCLALLYNLSHFALIRASSALSATVAGDLKIVLFTLLSMVPPPPPPLSPSPSPQDSALRAYSLAPTATPQFRP